MPTGNTPVNAVGWPPGNIQPVYDHKPYVVVLYAITCARNDNAVRLWISFEVH
jgi:hypothetical protein